MNEVTCKNNKSKNLLTPVIYLKILIIIVILTAWFLRVYGLSDKSFRGDEIHTIIRASYPASEIISQQKVDILSEFGGDSEYRLAGSPPLWYLVTSVFIKDGNIEFWGRLPVAFAGVFCISLTFLLGKKLFGNNNGLLAAFLLALSPFHIYYSQDARYIIGLMLLTISNILIILYIKGHNNVRGWVIFILITLLNIYNHFFGFLILGLSGLFFLLPTTISNKKEVVGHSEIHLIIKRNIWQYAPVLLVSLLVVLLLYFPQWSTLFELFGGVAKTTNIHNFNSSQPDYLKSLMDVGKKITTDTTIGVIFYGLFFLTGVIQSTRRNRNYWTFIILWWFLPILLFLILNPILVSPVPAFSLRHLIVVLPVFLVFVAQGMLGSFNWFFISINNFLTNNAWIKLVTIIIVLTGIITIQTPALNSYYKNEKQNWRDAVNLIDSSQNPDDIIVVTSPYRAINYKFYSKQAKEIRIVSEYEKFAELYQQQPDLCFLRVMSGADIYDRQIVRFIKQNNFQVTQFPGIWSGLEVACNREQ